MSEETRSEVYAELAATGPYGVHPGHALITMVEPHPGHEYAYNRWYEDDHYYAYAMAMPWMYAGRRWVATRDLQLLRYPEKSAVAQPVTMRLLHLHVLGHRRPLRRPHEVDRRHQQAAQPRRPRLSGPYARLHGVPGPRGDGVPGRGGGPARLPRAGPSVCGAGGRGHRCGRGGAAGRVAGVAAGQAPSQTPRLLRPPRWSRSFGRLRFPAIGCRM